MAYDLSKIFGCGECTDQGIKYSGPTLPCTGVTTCDSLETALQKMDLKICSMSNTTTTTTVHPFQSASYKAVVSQSGTNTPTAAVLQGEISDITYFRETTGRFVIIKMGAFPLNKVFLRPLQSNVLGGITRIERYSPTDIDRLLITNYDEFGNLADGLSSLSIAFQVFN